MEPPVFDQCEQLQKLADEHVEHHRYDEASECHYTALIKVVEAICNTTDRLSEYLKPLTKLHNHHLEKFCFFKYDKAFWYSQDRELIEALQCLSQNISCNDDDATVIALKWLSSFVVSSRPLFMHLRGKLSSSSEVVKYTNEDDLDFSENLPSCLKEMSTRKALKVLQDHYEASIEPFDLLSLDIENIKSVNKKLVETFLSLEQSKKTKNLFVSTDYDLENTMERCGYPTESDES